MLNIKRVLMVIMILVLFCLPAVAKEYTENFSFSGDELKIANMIGKVEVRSGSGDQIIVTVKVRGDDAQSGVLDFEITEGSESELFIIFPTDDHKKYVYPELGRKSKTTIQFNNGNKGNSWLRRVFGSGDKITVRGKGSGLEVWADVLVEVPRGRDLKVKLGVGTINAADLQANLVLDTNSGGIEALGIFGDLVADTGSGKVKAHDITGDLLVDTGSGSVNIANCKGESISVDTGSGKVVGENLICSNLLIDTGSGSVKVYKVQADEAKIDTGSGAVEFQLDRMGTGNFVVDTGSGSIMIDLPEDASAIISADTGSGSMNNDLYGAVVKHKGRREMTLLLGDAEAKVVLDAGSGSISVK